MIKLGSWSLH